MAHLWELLAFTCLIFGVCAQTDCGQTKRDVVFLVDSSNTISDAEYHLQLEFLKEIVSCFSLTPNEIRIALITFALSAVVRFDFNEFDNNQTGALNFIMNIDRVSSGVNTRTDLAIKTLREDVLTPASGDRPDVDNTIVVFTDGRATRPTPLANQLALMDRTVNEFFSIGVGPDAQDIDEQELILIANDDPADHVFIAGTFDDLMPLKDTVVTFACAPCNITCLNGNPCDRTTDTCLCSEDFTGMFCESRLC